MKKILILGAGKIGSLIALFFAAHDDYDVSIADINFSQADNTHLKKHSNIKQIKLDITSASDAKTYFENTPLDAVISCLPYFCHEEVVAIASRYNLHYFDLTEDNQVVETVKKASQQATKAFVPQCGLAPGIIGIIANSLMRNFDRLHTVKLRVGALPVIPNNALKYALTWSTDGLINEYGNPCQAIKHNKKIEVPALEGLESLSIDGLSYECFNTSGGLGNLANTWEDHVNNLTYKSIRYPGHCKIMRILMNDLKLNQDRTTLKRILENALPRTYQDVVIIYVSVTGEEKGELIEKNYCKKFYSNTFANHTWGAIQMTTASSIAAVADIVLSNPDQHQGFVEQERFSLNDITRNRFGKIYLNNTEQST